MQVISLTPIGKVCSARSEPQDDDWDSVPGRIELDAAQFSAECLAGLADFSHAEIVFYMDRVDPAKIEKTARHPRNNIAWPKVGIFAQRAKNRPNRSMPLRRNFQGTYDPDTNVAKTALRVVAIDIAKRATTVRNVAVQEAATNHAK